MNLPVHFVGKGRRVDPLRREALGKLLFLFAESARKVTLQGLKSQETLNVAFSA
jgi:hypothetical protein